MVKNWAITIGINKYDYLQPLNYAKRDAQLMHDFLYSEANFERVFFFSDDSPDIVGKSTRPNRANLRRVLRELFETPFMSAGDNFWFFFSGHGIRHDNRDYLMPCDGNPLDIEDTAIPINFVTERLRRCGADNVVLILDACRSLAQKAGEGIGRQTALDARQQGVISIFSCSPQEYSYEIEALQQGAFTRALLDGLGIQGQCATVERLNQYLSLRVPEIVRQHKNGRQTPYIIAEPVNKSHLILVPRHATLADIATLKNDAYQAEVSKNLELAEQLWIRVLAAASGTDMDAINAIKRIERLRYSHPEQTTLLPSNSTPDSSKGTSPRNFLPTFEFKVVTVNAIGKISNRRNCNAKYFVEDLGNGITLKMVQIPGGTFTMGSPEDEKLRQKRESPQHQVKVPGFFMSKYQITQEQYQAVKSNFFQKLIGNKNNSSHFKGKKRPVEQVSWDEAVEFCQKLSQKTRRIYRLPSEAEWEYACRAGTTTPFYFGETINTDLANYRGTDWDYEATVYPGNYGQGPKGEFRQETTPVGSFPPNAFGLYDMHGNVWEWCQDEWHEDYNGAPIDGSAWNDNEDYNGAPIDGSAWNDNNDYRVLRGGSWCNNPMGCRSAYRYRHSRANRYVHFGFRLVCVVA